MPSSQPRYELQTLLGATLPCTCGVEHTVHTQAIVLQRDALSQVAACAAQHLPGRHVLVVSDDITHAIAGQRVSQQLQQAGYDVQEHVLPSPPEGRVMADDDTIAAVRAGLRPETDFAVAVGAGTVNDLVKLATFQAGLPFLTCPTAVSVNGFTSAIAAVMSQGVKRTLPAHLPTAVVADVDVIAASPTLMRQAGLGDLLSKSVSSADWKLGHLIKGGYYCETPLRMVEQAEAACRDHAVEIGQGEPNGIAALTQGLLLSGLSMAGAGSSSPASGGEHLLSHYWDMTAHDRGREEHLHGCQVGVATLVTARLYDKLRQLQPEAIDWDGLRRTYPDWPQVERELRGVHGPLADEVLLEAQKKYMPLEAKQREWEWIRRHWRALWEELDAILMPSASLREILQAAGAPLTVRELGIGADELRTAFLHAKDIRGRYTVLDFAHDLGVLGPLCDAVLEESGALG